MDSGRAATGRLASYAPIYGYWAQLRLYAERAIPDRSAGYFNRLFTSVSPKAADSWATFTNFIVALFRCKSRKHRLTSKYRCARRREAVVPPSATLRCLSVTKPTIPVLIQACRIRIDGGAIFRRKS
jgi:hypothetical protein